VGFKQAMQLKLLKLEKGAEPRVVRVADSYEDAVLVLLKQVAAGQEVGDKDRDMLQKKRKLIAVEKKVVYTCGKGCAPPQPAGRLRQPERFPRERRAHRTASRPAALASRWRKSARRRS
jgi:hypothetical protein